MKETRTAKLYDGLTAKQLARLTFIHTAEQNGLEIERVRGAVERKHYRCLDGDYIEWNTYWISVAQFWATEYWRKMFYLSVAMHGADTSEDAVHLDNLQRNRQALAVWHAVLAAWCDKHGLDLATAYKLAKVEHDHAEGVPVDQAEVDLWLEELASFAPRA